MAPPAHPAGHPLAAEGLGHTASLAAEAPLTSSLIDLDAAIARAKYGQGKPASTSWRAEAERANAGMLGLLEQKISAEDVVTLAEIPSPHDRGPAEDTAEPWLLQSWQYQATGKVTAAAILHDLRVELLPHGGPQGMIAKACKEIERRNLDDTFYMIDLANVLRMYKAWKTAMPRVTPFYAVKCNPEPGILRLLDALGTGFDCASAGEVEMMLKMGVHPSRIIFAHPCKRGTDIRFAKENGVDFTTFDTLSELHKIAAQHPGFKCVLRIRADDPDARVPLGLKYGADVDHAPELLRTARDLGLNVVGVSFHVGSSCQNLGVFAEAIANARQIFIQAQDMGFNMDLLDIGGGFTGHFDERGNVKFGEIASTINAALTSHFPEELGVRVIAEPGRYFAETAATLLTPIYGHRDRTGADGELKKDYWITDGLYGSFNCIIYDAQNPTYEVVRSPLLEAPTTTDTFKSTIWGPTCDSADCVYKDHVLPELRNGDWLAFPNAGAYTVAGACDFNGISATNPNKFYVFTESAVDEQPLMEEQPMALAI